METFEVEIKKVVKIKAKDLRSANEIVRDNYKHAEIVSFFDVDKEETHDVIGQCEMSSLSIFKDDSYWYDCEGAMWLKEFDDLK